MSSTIAPFLSGKLAAPFRFRAIIRADELWTVLLGALVGAVAALAVDAMLWLTQHAHELLFRLAPGARLSAQTSLPPALALPVPAGAGLLLGLFTLTTARWMSRRVVDPIEANALHGGTMSVRDSLILVAQTLISNCGGASVGLEAAYTQFGGAFASRLGRLFRLRRADLRLLVGCGAGGAIACAFDAPLTGAFYAYELVIGTYSLASLAPVVTSAITAVSVSRLLVGADPYYDVAMTTDLTTSNLLPVAGLAAVCALVGIAIMRGVTATEQIFRATRIPAWARPAIGGLAVGGLALITPAVLSSGHGALRADIGATIPLPALATMLSLKACASAISIGSGFRGGLFFASLFLGALTGKTYSLLLHQTIPLPLLPESIFGLIGMSAMATAIVGGPLTMSFLALETTGSLPLTAAVVGASVVSAVTVRRSFGYSFATWRFHLRGENIRSAVDIGWLRQLTVGRMMRRDVRTVPETMSLEKFRHDFPLGTADRVIAVQADGSYAGVIFTADAYAADTKGEHLADILHAQNEALLASNTIREALQAFQRAEADALAVIDPETRHVIGVLTEAHALRRYAEELDKRRRDIAGE